MEFRFTPTVVVLVFSICFLHIAVAMPRTVERQDEIITLDQSVAEIHQLEKTTLKPSVPEFYPEVPNPPNFRSGNIKLPGRIPCQFEEPTEESVCQEHCLPKGYSYGLCTNFTCSCI